MSTLVERWSSLRDREALGDALDASERADLEAIERAPEIQVYLAQMRELEGYLEGKEGEHPKTPDHQLVLRALSAVQLESPGARVRAIDHDRELASAADPEGPGWVAVMATALSVAMTLAAALALALYEPKSVRRGTDASQRAPGEVAEDLAALAAAPQPKVESLLRVRASERGARLRRREGNLSLAPGAMLGQGDRLESGERPGCFVVENQLEFCLAPNSAASLTSLAEHDLLVALERGHVSVHAPAAAAGRRFALAAEELQVSGEAPLSLGLERNDGAGLVRGRILRGRVRVSAEEQNLEVGELKSAVYRRDTREFDVVDLSPGPAQHVWELIATGRLGASAAPPRVTPERVKNEGAQDASPDAGAETVVAKAPRELMQEAWALLKDEEWSEAAQVYRRIAREAPASEEGHIVLVRLGDLLLERLGDPEGALSAYDRYLREGGGPLAAEARHGRITVFRRLGRADDERAAIEEYLRLYGQRSGMPSLEARLRVLTP